MAIGFGSLREFYQICGANVGPSARRNLLSRECERPDAKQSRIRSLALPAPR